MKCVACGKEVSKEQEEKTFPCMCPECEVAHEEGMCEQDLNNLIKRKGKEWIKSKIL